MAPDASTQQGPRGEEACSPAGKTNDVFRDTPVRLLGYCNEVGEAFRNFIPRAMVVATYGVSSCYALADASSKAYYVYQHESRKPAENQATGKAIEMFLEASLWQGLASVAIPGFTINRICALSTLLMNRSQMASGIPLKSRKVLVTLIGLCSIPLIIKPIDRATDTIVDVVVSTSRKLGLAHSLPHQHNFHEILENTADNLEID